PRLNGAMVSMALAFRQATEHLLSQQDFIDTLSIGGLSQVALASQGSFDGQVEVHYGHSNSTFVERTRDIEKASVTVRTVGGHGSGFVISSQGYVITNHHVVGQSKELLVIIGENEYRASVVRSNPARDVALLKIDDVIDAEPLYIEPSEINLGEDIFVVG